MAHIRRAYPHEEAWINEQYKEVGFLPSDLAREFVAIAEHAGLRAALGRLVPIGADCAELGGIYVLPEFRGLGLATEMVSHLLRQGVGHEKIFCLPFAHLVQLYAGLGFRPCEETEEIPRAVRDKLRWCNSQYEHPTLLLVRSR